MSRSQIFYLICVLFLVPLISANPEDDYHPSRFFFRAPRTFSGLFRRLLGRRKNTIRTGFQGTSIANGPYSSQPSSYYSSYLSNPFSQGNSYAGPPPSTGPSDISGFSSNIWSPKLSSYSNVVGLGSVPQAGTNYPTYTPPGTNPPGNLDFHAVLDQFVRSAGLSPHGDQDTSASTIQSKGDTPVFSFKKLYSFPFYLSTDQQANDGFNLQIPYMRKHIRRMFQEGSFKNPKFFGDKQSIQNWLHPKNWYYGQQALQQASSPSSPVSSPSQAHQQFVVPSTIQWPTQEQQLQHQQQLLQQQQHLQRLYRGKPQIPPQSEQHQQAQQQPQPNQPQPNVKQTGQQSSPSQVAPSSSPSVSSSSSSSSSVSASV